MTSTESCVEQSCKHSNSHNIQPKEPKKEAATTTDVTDEATAAEAAEAQPVKKQKKAIKQETHKVVNKEPDTERC